MDDARILLTWKREEEKTRKTRAERWRQENLIPTKAGSLILLPSVARVSAEQKSHNPMPGCVSTTPSIRKMAFENSVMDRENMFVWCNRSEKRPMGTDASGLRLEMSLEGLHGWRAVVQRGIRSFADLSRDIDALSDCAATRRPIQMTSSSPYLRGTLARRD